MKRHLILIGIVLLLSLRSTGQETTYTFTSAAALSLSGQMKGLPRGNFHRLDSVAVEKLPERVQELATNPAGLHLDFRTNSTGIKIKWTLAEYKILWNMTPLAVNGFDLYAMNDGKWQYVSSARPSGEENSVTITDHMNGEMRQYRLYFPLYTGLKELKLGIKSGAALKPVPEAQKPTHKVLIYGSSITQGASASRPGMAYPALVGRALDLEVLNFGFSGTGKMEPEMAALLSKIETDLFILDCVPNPSPQQIRERTQPFVKLLREMQPHTPILMVESVFRENAHWNQKLNRRVQAQNKAYREAFEALESQGYEKLYYLHSEELMGDDHEATIDGVHLSDLGHYRMAKNMGRKVQKIMKLDVP